MTSLVILIGAALILFAGSFFSKRRFGILGLALSAGYVLSGLWLDTAELMVSMSGIVQGEVVIRFVATLILLLLPAVVFFFHGGYSYKTITGRIIGSLLFTTLACAFMAKPMHAALVVDGVGAQALGWLVAQADLICGIGVMAAVFDVLLSKHTRHSLKREK